MAKNENTKEQKEPSVALNDIDAVIGSLDLNEMSKRYEIDISAAAAEPSNGSEPEADGEAAGSDEPQPEEQDSSNRFKTGMLDFLGTLVLIFSLTVFGVPMIIGKSKRKFSAAAGIILSLIVVICALSIVNDYRLAASAAAGTAFSPPQQSKAAAELSPLLPDTVAQLKADTQGIVYPDGMLEKYRQVYALNKDVVGWLKIPNTSIDTLVTQGKNNSYYLKNDFYGQYTRYGNAFLDYRNNPKELSQNSIIYGHTTATKLQVFYDLYKYMDYDFYINNPVIEFGTLYEDSLWKVFSVYITNVSSKDDNNYFFYFIHPEIDTSKFTGYLNQIVQRSRFYTDIGVNDNDKILTLSTCVYVNNYPGYPVDSRLVIAARLMREGESMETDVLKVIDNPNYRRPQVWYSHFGKKNPYINSEKWRQ